MASLAAVHMVKDPLTPMESHDNISDDDTAATATRTNDALTVYSTALRFTVAFIHSLSFYFPSILFVYTFIYATN